MPPRSSRPARIVPAPLAASRARARHPNRRRTAHQWRPRQGARSLADPRGRSDSGSRHGAGARVAGAGLEAPLGPRALRRARLARAAGGAGAAARLQPDGRAGSPTPRFQCRASRPGTSRDGSLPRRATASATGSSTAGAAGAWSLHPTWPPSTRRWAGSWRAVMRSWSTGHSGRKTRWQGTGQAGDLRRPWRTCLSAARGAASRF